MAKDITYNAVPIRTKEEIAKVATISCQDPQLGDKIGEALSRVGQEGVINVDDSGHDTGCRRRTAYAYHRRRHRRVGHGPYH